jgi:hypothetical protein
MNSTYTVMIGLGLSALLWVSTAMAGHGNQGKHGNQGNHGHNVNQAECVNENETAPTFI